MKRYQLFRAGIAIASTLIVTTIACGPSRRGTPITPPLDTSQNEKLARGERVFMARCNECHVGGAAGLGPAINDKPLPRALIKFQIRNGLGAMPAFDRKRM